MSGANWTQAEYDERIARLKLPPAPAEAPIPAPAKAKGRMPWSQPMNSTERAYDAYLLTLRVAGEVRWWDFQPISIVLGPNCRFTPDFLVLYSDDRLELHDTKGAKKIKIGKRAGEKTFWAEEDARIKARVTAAQFVIPIYFVWSFGDGSWGKKGFGE